MVMAQVSDAFEQLNIDCFCLSLDREALAHALDHEFGVPGLTELVRERSPYVFAAQPVFVAPSRLQRIASVVRAVESVAALPAYRAEVLAEAPLTARVEPTGPQGVFFGYDFHLDHGRLGLIEINTNAGGAMLNVALARAQRSCCAATETLVPTQAAVAAFERQIVAMFRREWQLARRDARLQTIAIVDDAPTAQYLYPEFLLFQQLFERHGLRAVIADPAALDWRAGRLWHGDVPIDLVYNRLTDFYLEQPSAAGLRAAWLEQGVVLTPNPQVHALYADKRRLVLFGDPARLRAMGVPESERDVLRASVPRTELVTPEAGERLWAQRRGLFFKPFAGYGSRAAYRGDKLTRRVWQEILSGGYVAQALVPPGERRVAPEDRTPALKFDLRAYAYAGQVQWVAARLYQGQTTNFRTPGGGFAPVYTAPAADVRAAPGAEHASHVFLLGEDGEIEPLPHRLYVSLACGQTSAPALAGRSLRVADLYVRMKDGEPESIVNESYRVLHFDCLGRANTVAAVGEIGWPTAPERERMQRLLFGGMPPSERHCSGGTAMDIKVLGTGCANCRTTIALIEQVARDKGVPVTVGKVEEPRDIMGYGVMSTPGVVIDGRVVHAGGVPTREKIAQWLAA
jgi:small redox-active disulfide protein 2